MSRRIGPVVRVGPFAAQCTYWPLSRAEWRWKPEGTCVPRRIARGFMVEWLCLDWTFWRAE